MNICIDAGHCKLTPGKRSFDNSFYEYEFNYDVANRIKNYLEKYNLEVWIQQIEDPDPVKELNARIAAINRLKPDFVVSIHANAFGTAWNTANGWEIFCYKPEDEKSQGTKLAKAIQKNSINILRLKDRGIKNAKGVAGIVTKTLVPAVLIEHGFYTNKEELKKLSSSQFREKCAEADVKGILDYLGLKWINEEEKIKEHWAEKHLDSLVNKGLIKNPEMHRVTLDETMTKGQLFALIDRITSIDGGRE